MGPSESSRALDSLLSDGGPEADAITIAFHRTVLWRFRTGNGKPNVESAARLERLSRRKVPANGWEDKPPVSRNQTKRHARAS